MRWKFWKTKTKIEYEKKISELEQKIVLFYYNDIVNWYKKYKSGEKKHYV